MSTSIVNVEEIVYTNNMSDELATTHDNDCERCKPVYE